MRTAIVYNFLIESTIIASLGIVLMLVARRFLRRSLGSRALVFGWVLVGARLLCPLVLPNPLINQIRPPAVRDWVIRPIAGQVKIRLRDLTRDLYYLLDADSRAARWVGNLVSAQYSAQLSWALFGLWIVGMICVSAWFAMRWARRRGEWKHEIFPALCCCVHWFNPLVWLSWRALRSDWLLCCAEPKQRKPWGIAFAAVASMLLVFAFATGECTAPMVTSATLPAQTTALPTNADDETVLAHIKALCRQPGFDLNMDDADWTLERHACGYSASAVHEDAACRVNLLPDGQLVHWDVEILDPQRDEFGIEVRASDAQSEEIAQYTLALMDRLNPGQSDRIEAFRQASTTEQYDGSVTASTTGVTYVYKGQEHPGVSITCQIQPSVRVLRYTLEPPILQRLWEEELEPLPSLLAETLGGMPSVMDESEEVYGDKHRLSGLMTAEEAFEKALVHIRSAYDETDRTLRRFEVHYGLNTEGEPNRWYFHLRSITFGGLYIDGYEIAIDAHSGDVLYCYGMTEGNG